jgi:hypothetical protein
VALARDLSDLPAATGKPSGDGITPDATPRFAHVLARAWQSIDLDAGERPMSAPTALRHSWAGKCARELALHLAGYPPDPMDLSGVHNVNVGKVLHELWGEHMAAAFPDAEVLLEVDCRIDGLDASGHADALVIYAGRRIVVELKSIGGYGFKSSIGAGRGPAEGPKREAVLQGALNGLALDADEVVVAYLAKECLSVNEAARQKVTSQEARFVAEWTFTRERYEPLARAEAKRLQRIVDLYREGVLAPTQIPSLPAGSRIVNPAKGMWETRQDGRVLDLGTSWHCDYCPLRKPCTAINEPGPVAVADARKVA